MHKRVAPQRLRKGVLLVTTAATVVQTYAAVVFERRRLCTNMSRHRATKDMLPVKNATQDGDLLQDAARDSTRGCQGDLRNFITIE